jgi:hypothetical protein
VLTYTTVSFPNNYQLWTIPNLVTPVAVSIWIVGFGEDIRSISISPNGILYGGNFNGIVYELNWNTGGVIQIIPGFPTIMDGFFPYSYLWFTFDLTGNTLYIPISNATVDYVLACYLPSGDSNATMIYPSLFYSQPWTSAKSVVFYGD